MFDYANDSITFCLQLNKSRTSHISRTGAKEEINDEDQLDRIFARSDARVYIPGGDVPGKCIVIQHMEYDNPYVFLVCKVVSEEDANLIKTAEDIKWKQELDKCRAYILESRKTEN